MNLESQMLSAGRHLRKELTEIPGSVLRHCRGIVFLTMVKGAFLWSASLSTGLVIRRISPSQWSPPCSLGMASLGFGFQAGGEKVDIIIIIADDQEINTFAGTGQLKLGVEYGLAAGPIGRDIDISAYMSPKGLSCNMYYSRSKGAFAGFSLEGAILISRWALNNSFYGAKVKVKDVLSGNVPVPAKRKQAVDDFHALLFDFEQGRLEAKIGTRASSAGTGSRAESSGSEWPLVQASTAQQQQKRDDAEDDKQAEQELLLHFSSLGETGKNLLKTSLESGSVKAVFEFDHVVDESDPINEAFGIIGAVKGDKATILEGSLETGMGGDMSDYVRVRVDHSGFQREGVVSRHVLKKM